MNSVVLAILLVAFVIAAVLLVLLVLVQDQQSSGMGGLLGGGTSQAFGSHSASVLTKATVVFVALFFVLTFVIAKAYSTKNAGDFKAMNDAAVELQGEQTTENTAPAVDETADTNEKWWKTDDSSAENISETASETAEASFENTETTSEAGAAE